MDAVRRLDESETGRLPARDVAWRHRLLRSAGLPEELSRALAASREHDLHGLLELLQQGCPAATALRITALDEHMVGA